MLLLISFFFFFNDTATTEIYTLSLHDALPICPALRDAGQPCAPGPVRLLPAQCADPLGHQPRRRQPRAGRDRSEEHTSELQSPCNLVCRLLLEKKNIHPPSISYVYYLQRQAHT